MAIDRMKKITVVTQVTAVQRLIKALHDLGVVELQDAAQRYGDTQGVLRHGEAATEDVDRQLHQIHAILALLDTFVPQQKGFFEGLTPLPLIIEPEDLQKALRDIDLDDLYEKVRQLEETYRRAERSAAEARAQLAELEPFESLPVGPGHLALLKRARVFLGFMPSRNFNMLALNAEAERLLAWEVLAWGEPLKLAFACLAEDEAEARRLLSGAGFEEAPLPATHDGVKTRMQELREDIAEAETRLASIRAQVEAMAPLRQPVEILRGFWESNRAKALARASGLTGKWVQVLCGYVRERDLPRLQRTLKREFPESALTVEDPAHDEEVPVSLTLPKLVRPIQLLIDLFGRPAYNTFDPSPFLIFNFYLFFGICFGDVFYGVMLVALSLYLRSRTKAYPGVYNFSMLFLYAGVSTIVFGALLGSWFGDLWKPEYLGEGNILERLRNLTFAGLDPLEKPLPALGLALLIGALNQFYGIALKVYGAARNRDWAAALFDGMLWLIVLPGLLLTAAGATTDLPPVVTKFGLLMTALGALGLVFTQGRGEEGLASKSITGIVSLYGILGSYGVTAFIGDTLSYCRLLALGVTTSVVAMSVNIMAGMLRDVPYVGIVLFVLVLALGHGFNFGISVLGAFIHSMRLIFVEFFGRFYEGGARPFRPLGFDSPEFTLKKTP